jgi:hypothetical protein
MNTEDLMNSLSNSKNIINNPFDLLKILVLSVDKYDHLSTNEKKTLIIKTIHEIAAGKDGILNTEDDLISPRILKTLKVLIKTGIITSTLDLLYEISPMRIIKTPVSIFTYCCCSEYDEEDQFKEPLLPISLAIK